MLRRPFLALLIVLMLTVSQADAQSGRRGPLETAVRAFTPQSLVQLAEGPSDTVEVRFTRADLAGSGKFDFVVAAYMVRFGGRLRVLRQVSGKLQLAGDVEPSDDIDFGNVIQMRLEDIDNDGKPEVVIENYGSRTDYGLDVFKWTGHSLVSLLSGDFETENATLEDLNHNGKLAMVVPPNCPDPDAPCKDTFKVYKFDGTQFKLAFTSPDDPTNPTSASAQPQDVFAFRALLKPTMFSLKDVNDRNREHDGEGEGRVSVVLGNLVSLSPGSGSNADATQIDLTSLILGRTVKPLSARIRKPQEADEDEHEKADDKQQDARSKARFQGPFVEARFNRAAVLALLPKAQMDKPLAPGDVVTLNLTGKMKNGAPLHASVAVLIKGEHDRDKNDRH